MNMLLAFIISVLVLMHTCNQITCDRAEIFQEVLKAVKSVNITDSVNILEEHMFMKNKEKSVWKYIPEDTAKMFNIKMEEKELLQMDKSILKISGKYKQCKGEKGKEKKQCMMQLFSIITSYTPYFSWNIGAIEYERPKFAQYRITYEVLSLLNYKIINFLFDQIGDKKEKRTIKEKFKHAIKTFFSHFNNYKQYTITYREDQVSAVEICSMKEVLWKKFNQVCEKRWKRNVFEDTDKNVVNGKKKDSIEIDEGSADKWFVPHDPYQVFPEVERIGGVSNDFNQLYQAKVYDYARNGSVVFIEEGVTSDSHMPRGKLLQKLSVDGNRERAKYLNTIKSEVVIYVKKYFGVVEKCLQILMEQLK